MRRWDCATSTSQHWKLLGREGLLDQRLGNLLPVCLMSRLKSHKSSEMAQLVHTTPSILVWWDVSAFLSSLFSGILVIRPVVWSLFIFPGGRSVAHWSPQKDELDRVLAPVCGLQELREMVGGGNLCFLLDPAPSFKRSNNLWQNSHNDPWTGLSCVFMILQ